jgi:hypothetical protein
MLKKSMLPPTFSCEVRARRTPRSWNSFASERCTIVADDRQPRFAEAVGPVLLAGDEDRDAVHEAAAGLEDLLDVPLGRLLGAHGEVGDDDVGLGLLEDADDVVGRPGRFRDLLFQVLAEAVMRHAAVDGHVELRHVGELHRVVLARPDRLGQVFADLVLIDVERRRELDVGDVVSADVHVHEARNRLVGVRVLVVLDALHEGRCAVAHAHNRHPDLLGLVARGAVVGDRVGHREKPSSFHEKGPAGAIGGKYPAAGFRYTGPAPRMNSRRTWNTR